MQSFAGIKCLCFTAFSWGSKFLKSGIYQCRSIFNVNKLFEYFKVCKMHMTSITEKHFLTSLLIQIFPFSVPWNGVQGEKHSFRKKNLVAVLSLPNNFLMNPLLFCDSHTPNSSGRKILLMSSLNENGSQYFPSGSEGKVVFWFVTCQKLGHVRQLRKMNCTNFCTSQPETKYCWVF